jgi:NADPH:quinone reductase-like Zn-dependent oxidoreductase
VDEPSTTAAAAASQGTRSQGNTMQAIVYHEYGASDVLALRDVSRPAVKDGEVLVRVRAASVNPYDWHFMTGLPYFFRMQTGMRRPTVNSIGADLAGEVEAVGANVTQVRPGDEVFGLAETGSFAQYVSVPEASVVLKASNLTFAQASAVPMAGLTALQGLRDIGRVQAGQKVLINGAAGGVGTFAVQLAASFGAEVTGVCSTRNVDMVRSIGADHVIDYTREDFTRGRRRYYLMLDLIGNHAPSACRRVLNPKGVYVASFGLPDRKWLGPGRRLLGMLVVSLFASQKMVTFVAKTSRSDLQFLNELIEDG